MASSTHDHHHQHFPPPSTTTTTTTSAPPPTPSTTTTSSTSTTTTTTDLLSRLLHRLPPSLSTTSTPLLLRRRSSLSSSPTTTTTTPPVIPFTDLNSSLSSTLPTVSELGFFQLIDHNIPSELAHSAESDSVTLFNLSSHQKHQHFPTTWPLGFNDDDDDVSTTQSLFLDSSCSTGTSSELESSELVLSSLREFTREMEKVGLAVVEALTCAVGVRNPGLDDPGAVSTLMWVSENCSDFVEKMVGSGRFYPYVVGLHYQIRGQSCSLLTDTGLVSVLPEVDSILITLGDIAQVWSNGKLKKVRGKPALNVEEGGSGASSLSMSLLVTLPLESTVSPLIPRAVISSNGGTDNHGDENNDIDEECREERLFGSFPFEDYAWRVYHERVPLKDPLDRYRNKL